MPSSDDTDIVTRAITSRRSVRGFRADPVPRPVIEAILKTAARAPSGTNMQPWQVHVLTGPALDRLGAAATAAYLDPDEPAAWPYRYYPDPFVEPYLSRRRKVGWDLYGLLGIEKGDTARMQRQHARNFRFFGAPVGMIFTIDDRLEIGSWLDFGMFLQSIMIAARGHGLHTCPQAAFAGHQGALRRALALAEDRVVVCGMALGTEDTDARANALRTDRAPLADWARFHHD